MLVTIAAIVLVVFFAQTDEARAKIITNQYYDAMEKGNYEIAFNLLYRSEDTIFTDEFLIRASSDEPLLYLKVQDVHKIADGLYEVISTAEIDDGNGKQTIKNYVIKYESQFFFVINWTDVPEELFDFTEAIGY